MTLARVAVACALAALTIGCHQALTRAPVDLGPARMSASHAPVVIEGRDTSPGEWASAASVPFNPDGTAQFLWDPKGLYVGLRSQREPPTGDESLCIAVSGGTRGIRIYIRKGPTLPSVTVTPTVFYERSPGTGPATLPRPEADGVRWSAHAQIAAQQGVFPWWAELFVRWEALGESGPPAHLWVHVFRILGERPYSMLEMNPGMMRE